MKAREPWIDTARGIAIVLVVLYHAVMYLGVAGIDSPWSRVTTPLDTFRMPLFFFMSGLLAPSALRLGYRELFRKRILLLVYLYVLWSTAQTTYSILMPPFGADEGSDPWSALVTIFIWPHPNLWFIYALPLYFTIAWLVRRAPVAVQLGGAAIVSAAFGTGALSVVGVSWDKTGRYLFFFMLAIHVAPLVRRLAPRARLWHVVALFVVYAGVFVVTIYTSARHLPFVLIASGLVAVAAGVALSVVVSRIRWLSFFERLGSRTLPIYLVHTFPMVAVAGALFPIADHVPSALSITLPPVLVIGSIGLALLANRLLGRVPGVFTFPIPRWTTQSSSPVSRDTP